MEAIAAVIKLIFVLAFLVLAAALGPPIIIVWTLLDKSRPFWKVCLKRYLWLLLEMLSAGI